ncbi:GGDEF domain-containing protein [Planosporangium thailandense]|uniref:GGDEF domain-containing protein n=1 Tax=Planosporangium thailandense TaxID=765197 RepID=A0ABX0Y2T8_9ACTN|nr:GGDEF domain-containing protein [Planosporangium thailandense]NJC72706.1 GGDEF domain-containing protein [Planosporangium thailandense]
MGSVRETSGITVGAILGYVRTTGGPEAVTRTLVLAGAIESPEAYEDTRRWYTWDFKIRLFEAAAIVLDDPHVARNIGIAFLQNSVSSALILAMSLIGGPTQFYRVAPKVNTRFSTCAEMTAVRVRRGAATLRYRVLPQYTPNRHDCEYTAGLLMQVPCGFGLPMGVISHPECQVDGAPACVFEVRWAQPRRFWRWRRGGDDGAGAFQGAMADQLTQLQHTVAELVAARAPDKVLATIAERAGFAVNAHSFLLVAQPSPDEPPQVHGFGLTPAEFDQLTADGSRVPPGPDRLIADIVSPTRRYGYLVAFTFEDTFLETEQPLLDAYANLTAVTLDALTAFEAAEERQRTAESLLGLARALTHARTPADVAAVTAEAAHAVLHADKAAMLLLDDAGSLRMAAHVGWPPEARREMDRLVLEAEQSPLIFQSRRADPTATRIYDHTAEDSLIRRVMTQAGVDVMAVVGISLPERLYGVLAAGFTGPQGAARAQQFIDRMPGIADQAANVLRTCELLEQTWQLAHLDALTGLPNRRAFMAELTEAVADRPGALLFIDLDGFKDVNDSFGHAAGDDLLAAVADRLRGCVRSDDLVARLGGDEFVILSRQVEDEAGLFRLAERVREAFTEPVVVAGTAIPARLSVDGTLYRAGERTEDVLHRADSAMYRAKRSRRPLATQPRLQAG